MKIRLLGLLSLLSLIPAWCTSSEGLFPKIASNKNLEQAQEEFKRFIEHYRPPHNICKKIHEHESDLWKYDQENDDYTWHHEKTPEMYFKHGDRNNFMRVVNSEILRKCIADNHMSYIKVPQKWIYPIKNKWFVVAEYVPDGLDKFKKLEVKHVRELTTFFTKTGYSDMLPENIKFTEENGLTVAFIDTEDRSFTPNKSKIEYADNVLHFENRMTGDAQKWIKKYIEKLKEEPENKNPYDPTPEAMRVKENKFDYRAIAIYASFLEKKEYN